MTEQTEIEQEFEKAWHNHAKTPIAVGFKAIGASFFYAGVSFGLYLAKKSIKSKAA